MDNPPTGEFVWHKKEERDKVLGITRKRDAKELEVLFPVTQLDSYCLGRTRKGAKAPNGTSFGQRGKGER